MEVVRVFNNNVLLAKDGERDVILTGRGLGFQAKPGQKVKEEKIFRVFVPQDGRDPDHLAELLAEIPPEMIRLVSEAMTAAGLGQNMESRPTLVMALADHITGAMARAHAGTVIAYPLEAEVRALYPLELEQAERIREYILTRIPNSFPEEETVALALHLVNAGFATGDLAWTYTMTGVIQQMIAVIEEEFHVTLNQHTVSVGRFITHVRYLFVRVSQHKQTA